MNDFAKRDEVAVANLIYREEEREMMPLCVEEKIAVDSLSVKLTTEDMATLEEPYVPHPLVGLIPYGGQLLLSAQR